MRLKSILYIEPGRVEGDFRRIKISKVLTTSNNGRLYQSFVINAIFTIWNLQIWANNIPVMRVNNANLPSRNDR